MQEIFLAEEIGYRNTLGMNNVSLHQYSTGTGVLLSDLEPTGHTG